jgi:chromosome segregation ATPase
MWDLTEIQYYLGEARRCIPLLEDRVSPLITREKRLKAEIDKLRDELAEVQTKKADILGNIATLEDAISKLEPMKSQFFTEADAVAVLKSIRDGRYFDRLLGRYSTELQLEQERVVKALRTIGAEWEQGQEDDLLYYVDVVSISSSYREFLYGAEEAEVQP